jgi:hypothetical protein
VPAVPWLGFTRCIFTPACVTFRLRREYERDERRKATLLAILLTNNKNQEDERETQGETGREPVARITYRWIHLLPLRLVKAYRVRGNGEPQAHYLDNLELYAAQAQGRVRLLNRFFGDVSRADGPDPVSQRSAVLQSKFYVRQSFALPYSFPGFGMLCGPCKGTTHQAGFLAITRHRVCPTTQE